MLRFPSRELSADRTSLQCQALKAIGSATADGPTTCSFHKDRLMDFLTTCLSWYPTTNRILSTLISMSRLSSIQNFLHLIQLFSPETWIATIRTRTAACGINSIRIDVLWASRSIGPCRRKSPIWMPLRAPFPT